VYQQMDAVAEWCTNGHCTKPLISSHLCWLAMEPLLATLNPRDCTILKACKSNSPLREVQHH